MPMVLARLEEDTVAGADDFDRASLALAEADALGDPDRLAERVRVPCGARTGGEVGGRSAERGRLARRGDRVDIDGAAEPVARPVAGVGVVACDQHLRFSFRSS